MLRERSGFLFIALVACFLMANASLAHEEPNRLVDDQPSLAWDQDPEALKFSNTEPVEDGFGSEGSDLVEDGISCREAGSLDFGEHETLQLAGLVLDGGSFGEGLIKPDICPGCRHGCHFQCGTTGGRCHNTGCFCMCY